MFKQSLVVLLTLFIFMGYLSCIKIKKYTAKNSNKVIIKKTNNDYNILINGKPTYLKGIGVGYATGLNGEDYLQLARDMGATAVRTWGIDQGTYKYLEKAYSLGLYVNAGLWLNSVSTNKKCSYISDLKYKNKVRKDIINYIKKYKNHPSIISWNVGNEVFYFTKDEKERIAFAKFLNLLIKDIKKIDKNHPVIYTSASTTGLEYIIKYVPEVDILGLNLYGGVSFAIHSCREKEFNGKKLNRPVIITEIGPRGPWDSPKDINGISVEQSDYAKAITYKSHLRNIKRNKDIVLGTYVFHLGETTQESLTWWNVNYGNLKLQSYWAVSKIYKQIKFIERCPKIESFELNKNNNIKPGEWLNVELKVNYLKKDNLVYDFFASTVIEKVMKYYVNKKINIKVDRQNNNIKIKAPKKSGRYRVYVLVKDKKGNAAIRNVSIKIVK